MLTIALYKTSLYIRPRFASHQCWPSIALFTRDRSPIPGAQIGCMRRSMAKWHSFLTRARRAEELKHVEEAKASVRNLRDTARLIRSSSGLHLKACQVPYSEDTRIRQEASLTPWL